jgi:hypothetical protein
MSPSVAKTIAFAIDESNSICQFQKRIALGIVARMNEAQQEIRRQKLKREIEREESVAAFARKYAVDATYMRQLLSKHRPFGEKTAKKLEEVMGKPAGWLSVDDQDDQILEVAALMRRLSPIQRSEVLGYARGMAALVHGRQEGAASATTPSPAPHVSLDSIKARQAINENAEELNRQAVEQIGKIRASRKRKKPSSDAGEDEQPGTESGR